MPFKKGNTAAQGRGAVQTGSRPKAKYYSVYGARFRQEDNTGRKFKARLKEEGLTMCEFIIRCMHYDEDIRCRIQQNLKN